MIPLSIGGSTALLIDTPGFDDTTRTDSDILTEIARTLSAQYKLGVQLKGIIYMHRITDVRFNRSSVKTFEILKKICGHEALKNVLLATSRWSETDEAIGADRERQLKEKFWAYMVDRGSNISRFHGDRNSAISLVSQLLVQDNVVLQLQKELIDEGKNLNDTVAGAYVDDNLEKLKLQVKDELASIEKLKQDLLENDRAMKRQARLDWERESARLRELQNQQVSLQHPVGIEVINEIQQKKSSLSSGISSGLSKIVPFVPVVISILASFCGIPPGLTEIFTGWMADC